MRVTTSIIITILLLSQIVKAQVTNPGQDEVYREGEISEVNLTMSAEDKAFLLHDDNIWSDIYLPTTFHFKNSVLDTLLALQVGIRLRGNSSRNHAKKSFKIKFKEFGGTKFFDNKKFNLRAENNDPTLSRNLLSLKLNRDMGVAAARSHITKLYINDEYMGVYLNIEQIDDEFVQSRYDNDEGNLYKCSWGATLEDNGQINNEELYELQTNEDINDRTILANFVDVLNNSSDTDFKANIEEVFNVEDYLSYLAMEAILGHWDGYSYNKNNYYLYENALTNKVEFIAYDLDNTFGMDWIGGDWGQQDVTDWIDHNDQRPLSNRILDQPSYYNRYIAHIDQLLKNDFTEEYLFPIIDALHEQLATPVEEDTYFPLTFGFTYEDFENSITQPVADHLPYGFKPYITTRSTTARQQIGDNILSVAEVPSFIVYPNPVQRGQAIHITTITPIKTVNLFQMDGRQVSSSNFDINNSALLIADRLTPGLYIVNIDGHKSKLLIE